MLYKSLLKEAILWELIQYAKENGIEIINLDVRKDNEQAIRLYGKFTRHIEHHRHISKIVSRLCCYVS